MINTINTPADGRDPFLLVTLDGLALRQRVEGSHEWRDTALAEKGCILLAFLALVSAAVPRRLLCDLLWEGAEGEKARNSLRQTIFRIRRVIGVDSIVETPSGLLLAPGVIEVDVVRAMEGLRGTSDSADRARQIAELFGTTLRPAGQSFEDWRARVRRQLSNGDHHVTSAFTAKSEVSAMGGSGQLEQSARRRLSQLFRLSQQGIPLTIWATGRPEVELRSAVHEFAAACRDKGAIVAAVSRRAGVGYARFALENELAEVLWPLPGAAGITPDHRDALDALSTGGTVAPGLIREAILDLIAAVAENQPLVMTLGDPGRYSLGALSSLVEDLAGLRDRSVMLVIAEHSGVRPVHTLCIEVPVSSGRRHASAATESESMMRA